jgi:FkbM family methyltransferase
VPDVRAGAGWANGLRLATAKVSRAAPRVPGKMRLASAADSMLRRLAACPDPLAIEVSGVRFEVTTSDINDFRVMYAPSVEEGVTEWLVRTAGTTPVVIWDVGANVGGVSLNVTARCPRAQLVAIEASPRMAARLQRNVGRNRALAERIIVLPVALAESSGEIAFYESAEPANGGVGRLAEAGNTETKSCLVAGWAGDDLIDERLAPPPDIIKIDVEGFELPALTGLREHLTRRACDVLFEHEAYRINTPNNPPSPIAWLRSLGYRLWLIDESGRPVPVPGDPPVPHCDLLATKAETP